MASHELKTDTEVFKASSNRTKSFEIRFNDRNYKIDDELLLMETKFTGEEMKNGKPLEFTGRELNRTVEYILNGGYGLADGWVVMSVF